MQPASIRQSAGARGCDGKVNSCQGATALSPPPAHTARVHGANATPPAAPCYNLQAVMEAEGKAKTAEREAERLRAKLRALSSRDEA